MKNYYKTLFASIVILVLLLTIPISIFSQNSDLSKTEKKTFKQAEKMLKHGETKAALDLFLAIYRETPNNIDNLYKITEVYYDELSDYKNAYKYGKELLDVAKKTISTNINSKEKNRINEIIQEIELLISVVKDDINERSPETTEEEKNISTDTIVTKSNYESQDNESNTSTISEEEPVHDFKDNTVTSDFVIQQANHNNMVTDGFIPINQLKSDDYNFVIQTYREIKNEGKFKSNDFKELLSESENINDRFNSFLTNNLIELDNLRIKLIKSIYNYNNVQYCRDSSEKKILYLTNRNHSIQQEINLINKLIEVFSTHNKNISNFNARKIPKTFVGRFLITKSVDEKLMNKILIEIKNRIIKGSDINNSEINKIFSFIHSEEDNKYLYVVVSVTENTQSNNSDSAEINTLNNLEVFSFDGNRFINIVSGTTFILNESGLRENEQNMMMVFVNSTKEINNKESDFKDSLITPYYLKSRLNELNDELNRNNTEINTFNVNYDSIIDQYFLEYTNILNNYYNKIKSIKNYISFIEIKKEIETKTTKEQLINLVKFLTNMAISESNNLDMEVPKIITLLDTVDLIPQIKFYSNRLSLKPVLTKGKIMFLSKLTVNNQSSNYLVADVAFEVSYNEPNSESVINSVALEGEYDDVQESDISVESDNNGSNTITKSSSASNSMYSISKKENILIIKDKSNKKWKMLEDNPSSYISYTMYEKEEGWRLPTFQELRNIMQYLANNPAFLQKAEWSNQNAIYISQEIRFDNRNNRLLKGILLTGNTITTKEVQDGDEVYIIVISDN